MHQVLHKSPYELFGNQVRNRIKIIGRTCLKVRDQIR